MKKITTDRRRFRYRRNDANPFEPSWRSRHVRTDTILGHIKRLGPGRYIARAIHEDEFGNREFGLRVEASRWLFDKVESRPATAGVSRQR